METNHARTERCELMTGQLPPDSPTIIKVYRYQRPNGFETRFDFGEGRPTLDLYDHHGGQRVLAALRNSPHLRVVMQKSVPFEAVEIGSWVGLFVDSARPVYKLSDSEVLYIDGDGNYKVDTVNPEKLVWVRSDFYELPEWVAPIGNNQPTI